MVYVMGLAYTSVSVVLDIGAPLSARSGMNGMWLCEDVLPGKDGVTEESRPFVITTTGGSNWTVDSCVLPQWEHNMPFLYRFTYLYLADTGYIMDHVSFVDVKFSITSVMRMLEGYLHPRLWRSNWYLPQASLI